MYVENNCNCEYYLFSGFRGPYEPPIMYGGSLPRKLPRQNNQNSSITAFKYADAQDIGMASNKMSIVTIFGHKYFKQRFHQFSHFFTKVFNDFQ